MSKEQIKLRPEDFGRDVASGDATANAAVVAALLFGALVVLGVFG